MSEQWRDHHRERALAVSCSVPFGFVDFAIPSAQRLLTPAAFTEAIEVNRGLYFASCALLSVAVINDFVQTHYQETARMLALGLCGVPVAVWLLSFLGTS